MRAISMALGAVLMVYSGALAANSNDCQQENDSTLAIRACTRIIEGRAQGEKAAAYSWRSLAHSNLGDYDAALADIEQSMRLDPKDLRSFNRRGLALLGKGDAGRAIADFDAAVRANPQNPTYYRNRCRALTLQNDFRRAIADCDEAIRLSPKIAASYIMRGNAYNHAGDYERAVADFGEAIRIEPQDSTAYSNRARALYNKGDNEHALADLDRAIGLNPKLSIAYVNRADIYITKGEYGRAITDCERALQADPKSAPAYDRRGWAYFKQGDKSHALSDIQEAVRLSPQLPKSRQHRGRIFLAMGDAKAALDDFNEALRTKADLIPVLFARGQAYEAQGLRSLALSDYKKAIELKAIGAEASEDQGYARARLVAMEAPPAAAPADHASQASLPAAVITAPVPIGRRVALVIGNSNYVSAGRLPNPANDAKLIAAGLRRAGFAEVVEKYDLDLAALSSAIKEFGDMTTGAEWAVVYYAGHGIEVNGVSYLVPVDAKLLRDTHVSDETVPLERVLAKVEAAKKLRLVILDACRNNPFVSRMVKTAGSNRSIGRGLAPLEPEGGVLVAYSAKHGTVAQDGAGANSPFATAVAQYLTEPGLEIQFLFRKVRDRVIGETGGSQEPFLYGSLGSEPLYFQR